MPAALQTFELTHRYGRLVALDSLTVAVAAGECLALIGANGSGKSTAVRTIAGMLEPTGGHVEVAGLDPHTEPEAERARAELALVPDSPLLYEDLSVEHHLQLVAVAHGQVDDGVDERIEALMVRLGIEHRRDFLPSELSRGMRQKTQLACALIRPFSVLVLDEPVVGLDPPSQGLLRRILLEAKQGGAAVLLTTHQMGFAEGLADRAVMLDEGAVADQGPWDEVSARAAARGWTSD